jgi:hypothetical protein
MLYKDALLEAFQRAMNKRATKIYLVIKLADSDNLILITASRDVLMGTYSSLMFRYVHHILSQIHRQYLKIKRRYGVSDEPEGGDTPLYLENFLLTRHLFLNALITKIEELSVDQLRFV